jgi:hypothetical protein
MKTSTVLLLGGVGLALAYLMSRSNAPVVTTVVRQPIPATGSATTAAEIAAGTTVATSLISDLFPSDSGSSSMDDTFGNMSLSGVYNDGEN